MLPTSLYIHIPWCIRKCPYCDFNSHQQAGTLPEMTYVHALIADLQNDLLRFPTRTLQSIFIGGGTPSLFSAEAYQYLFAALERLFVFQPEIEITLEANPGTVEQGRFHAYRQLGINRLSLGIQSFNPRLLKILGRIHDDKQAHQAIEIARCAGFDNLNLDFMYGLAEQSPEMGLAELKQAIAYKPEHISWYQLTLEPNTVFYKYPPDLAEEDALEHLEEEAYALLQSNGYQRYEISAFCRDDKMSRHNLNYWLFGDYYGIGAGAHAKLTKDQKQYRRHKLRQPKDFLDYQKGFLAREEILSEQALIFEFMLNTTRLEQMLPNRLFVERTGLSFSLLDSRLKLAEEQGLIVRTQENWQVSALGRRYTNNLQALFL